jgi:Cu-processing system permease protein
MWKITNYILRDLSKSWIIIGYVLLLFVASWGVFSIENEPDKAILNLLQILLLLLPLFTLVFTTIYYYNSLEFILLLLAQPIDRKKIYRGFAMGLMGTLSLCLLLGMGIPIMIHFPSNQGMMLLLCGLLLTTTFVAIALFLSSRLSDKAKGMGAVLLLWSFFAFLFDGMLLLFMYQFGAYPIESAVLAISFLNPIVIARTSVLMTTEAAAMLGLSGAVFKDFFGSTLGFTVSLLAFIGYTTLFYSLSWKNFKKKDM